MKIRCLLGFHRYKIHAKGCCFMVLACSMCGKMSISYLKYCVPDNSEIMQQAKKAFDAIRKQEESEKEGEND